MENKKAYTLYKIINQHSQSIDELYNFIALTEYYLKDLEKRVSELEKRKDVGYYRY